MPVQGALGIGNNFGCAFFLCDSIHGPTCLGRIVRNASNMPEFLVYFGFLYSSDTTEIQTSRMVWWNLEHYRKKYANFQKENKTENKE
jgi:hypothetical protein